MFQALEESNGGALGSSRNRMDPNNSQQSIGTREIEMMHKQFQESMNEKVRDLEQ